MWFDGHADRFDDCAGLGPAAGRDIARAVVELSGCRDDDVLLDLGAGTGTIAEHFAAFPVRYVGLDSSARMLTIFRRKLAGGPRNFLLLQADGDRPWPVRDHSLAAVFASRVAHHLEPGHLAREVRRACRPGGALLLGRVIRDADSLPSRLQRHKRELLGRQGVSARAGGQAVRQIEELCRAFGATPLGPVVAARWVKSATPRQILAAWEEKPQLHSNPRGPGLGADARAVVVSTLAERARQELGDLDRPHEYVEEYTLQGVRLP